MNYFLTLPIAMALLQTGSRGAIAVTYVSQQQIGGCNERGSLSTAPDQYRITCSHKLRDEDEPVEVHESDADLFFVQDGEATMVTGGTVLGPRSTGPGEIRGTSIQGGTTHHMGKGDMIVIPAGIPHWWTGISKPVKTVIVKVKQ